MTEFSFVGERFQIRTNKTKMEQKQL